MCQIDHLARDPIISLHVNYNVLSLRVKRRIIEEGKKTCLPLFMLSLSACGSSSARLPDACRHSVSRFSLFSSIYLSFGKTVTV